MTAEVPLAIYAHMTEEELATLYHNTISELLSLLHENLIVLETIEAQLEALEIYYKTPRIPIRPIVDEIDNLRRTQKDIKYLIIWRDA